MIDNYINREKIALNILNNIRKENIFPYFKIEKDKLYNSYTSLCNQQDSHLNLHNNIGIDIIKHFHPSIYQCSIKGKPSIYEAFFNDELLFNCIMNRLEYKNNNLTTNDIIQGFNVSKIAPKISLFKPVIAKYLIHKYLDDFNIIFDPCCGYSGRMLGCCSLDKQYIGQDINKVTIKEAVQIKNELKLNASLLVKDSLKCKGVYDCLFTCPPYSNKENWNQNIKVLSSEEWIDILIKNFACNTYLFVVDKPGKYKKYIVETINNKSHFSNNIEYVILIKTKAKLYRE